MVDFFLLLMLARAGDELQRIKKGSMELADAIKVLINKADDDNIPHAKVAKLENDRALHYLAPATEGWQRQVQINKLPEHGLAISFVSSLQLSLHPICRRGHQTH